MEKHFVISKRLIDSLSCEAQKNVYTRYVADAILDVQSLIQLEDEMDIILRVSTKKQIYPDGDIHCGHIDFGVNIEVIKPSVPKRYKKSKEEILIELKILIMTYINDLWRDFAGLDKPAESENSWKHIEKYIEDTFYNTPEVKNE